MPLSDAGKLVWRGGASSYIFAKDYSRIQEFAVKPLEDAQRAAEGTLNVYSGRATIKWRFELNFEDIGATQYRQFATVWKANTVLGFYRKQTDASKAASVWWVEGYNFSYSEDGIRYKNLYSGQITLEEV